MSFVGRVVGARILRGLQEGGEAPKVVVRFRIIRKQIPISLLRRLGSEIETTDFYLIRARKRAQFVG